MSSSGHASRRGCPCARGATSTLATAFDRRFSLSPGQMCGSRWQGRYAPFSAYESNLRRLAATVAAEVNAGSCNCSAGRVAGDRPDQVSMSAFCHWSPDAASSDCGACVALAFREAGWRCPYRREAVAVVDGGACSVSFHDVYRMEQSMGIGQPLPEMFAAANTSLFRWIGKVADLLDPDVLLILLFQATGVALVVFLFLAESRTRNRGHGSGANIPVTGDQLGLDA